MKSFKTDTKKLINVDKDNEMIKNLFVTQDEQEAVDEFEKEKDMEIEKELGKKIEVPLIKQGWGEWAGDGVNEEKHT